MISLSLRKLAVTGFWFCDRCERIVFLPLDLDPEHARCTICRKPTVRWIPPALEEKETLCSPPSPPYPCPA